MNNDEIAAELQALREKLDAQNAILEQAQAITSREAVQALADLINGQRGKASR